MTQEDKELLLKDLCARLPYFPKVEITVREETQITHLWMGDEGFNGGVNINHIKPFLRSLESMTEEEKRHFFALSTAVKYATSPIVAMEEHFINFNSVKYGQELVDWLNANHFDYRGLIPKGLAIEVTEENNPYI